MQKLVFIFFFFICLASCNSNTAQTNNAVDILVNENKLCDTIAHIATPKDKQKLISIFEYSKLLNLKSKSISEIEIEVAKQLLEIPYVGATLEIEGEETLVVNLRGLDCTTFVENVLTISLCIKNGKETFNEYCQMLAQFRYRDGGIDRYPSRLHYFTDWLIDNKKKGLIDVVSSEFGNKDFEPNVSFMSSNPEKYAKLASHPEFVEIIKGQEGSINNAKFKYITKDQLESKAKFIKDGDIIAFSTTIKGLDISHVAIAAFKNERLHFYHASSSKKKVVLSEKPMSEYMASINHNSGILVARLNE